MMIPCIKTKCLLFPVCKNKNIIYCESLLIYISSLVIKHMDKTMHRNIWLDINKELPKLQRVFPEPEKYVSLDTISIQSPFQAEFLSFMNRKGERFDKSL